MYENFAVELMRDQFIAGLTSRPLRVKLIGKGHRHRDTAQLTPEAPSRSRKALQRRQTPKSYLRHINNGLFLVARYLTIYADEKNAVEEETTRDSNKLPALGKN